MVPGTRTRRLAGAALAGLLLAAGAGAQDCMESFELPDDPERVVITDIGIEIEDMFALHRDGEDNPDGIEAPTIAFAWRAYDRSARDRPRPSLGRLRLFFTPAPPPDAGPDLQADTQQGCEAFEIEFQSGVRQGMQGFPLTGLSSDENVPPPGEYRVQIEVAHQDEQGLVRERNLGNNIASIDLNYYSDVAVTEAEATGSGLRLELVNGGTRQTEELVVKVFSDGGEPVEETVEAIPGVPFFDLEPEDFDENQRQVQVSITDVGTRITYLIEEVPTGRQVGGGSVEVQGGGGSGGQPGGGGGMPSVPGGSGTGTGSGGNSAPPPAPPRATQGPDYEVESIHILPGDARDGVYTVVANIRNNGGPTTDRADVEFQLQGARSRQSQSSQGNARIEDPMEDVGPIATNTSTPVMAILNLADETDPSRRADEVDIQVTVSLSGDANGDNDSKTETHRVSGAVDQAARPPDWERGEPWHYYHRPIFAFGPGYYVWRGDVRNQGGPAMSVEGELEVDASDWERFYSRGLALRATTGQGAPARAIAGWYVLPAYYPSPDDGGEAPRFKASIPVRSTYRGAGGAEEQAEDQEVAWEDIPFFHQYPSLDLAAKLTEPGSDDALEGPLVLNVDEPKEIELVITNNSELRILAGTQYTVEVEEQPSGILAEAPEESGEFEDLEASGSQRISPALRLQGGCDQYNGGGMGGMGGMSGMSGVGGMSGGGGAVSLGTLAIRVGFDRDSLEDIPDHIDDHDAENSLASIEIQLADPNGQCTEEEDSMMGGLAGGNPLSAVNTGLGLANTALEAAGVEDTGIDLLDTALDEGTGGLVEEGLEAAGVDGDVAEIIGDAASGDTQGAVQGAAGQAGVDIPEVPTGAP